MKKVLTILLTVSSLALFVSAPGSCQESKKTKPATKHLTVKRTLNAVHVDGRLDESAWGKAEAVKLELKNGGTPKQTTTARILWDDYYLYMAFEAEDDHIWGTMTKRDEPLYNEEVVEVFIDPDGDGISYLELEVNPLNILWDGYILNTASRRVGILAWNSLDMKWAVHLNGTVNDPSDKDQGWSVEMALPLKDIFTARNNPPKAGDKWRLNFYRIDRPDKDTSEGSAWSPVSGVTFHDPDYFGEVIFSEEVLQ